MKNGHSEGFSYYVGSGGFNGVGTDIDKALNTIWGVNVAVSTTTIPSEQIKSVVHGNASIVYSIDGHVVNSTGYNDEMGIDSVSGTTLFSETGKVAVVDTHSGHQGDVNGIEPPTARKYQLQISMNDDYTVNDDGELCDGYGNPVGYVKIDRYTYDGQTIKY